TLWAANDRPRLLAADTEENSERAKIEKKSELAPKAAEPAPMPSELPATWKQITRVDPSKYPTADAVLLRRRLNYTLGSSPAVMTEHDEFIQILTAEGKRFGDFDVSYAPPFEEIYFLDCEVLGADGKMARLDPDA